MTQFWPMRIWGILLGDFWVRYSSPLTSLQQKDFGLYLLLLFLDVVVCNDARS